MAISAADALDLATVVGTVGAAAAAAWAGISAASAARQTAALVQLESARREEELVRSRSAELRVFVERGERDSGVTSAFIVVMNDGPAAAFEVAVEILPGAMPQLVGPQEVVPRLGRGTSIRIRALVMLGRNRVDVRTGWTDANGSHDEVMTVDLN